MTGSHSMKFGYQGNYWRDDREMHVNTPETCSTRSSAVFPISITQYANPYNVNARAMQTSLYAQDQWTISRLTLQGAIRYDHPWSWFPEHGPAGKPVLPRRHLPEDRWRDRLQRHHAAHRRRL